MATKPDFKHKTTKLDTDKNHPHIFLIVSNPLSICIGLTDKDNNVCAFSQIVNGQHILSTHIHMPKELPIVKFIEDNEPIHVSVECIESFQFIPFRQQITQNPKYQIELTFPDYEFIPLSKAIPNSDKIVFVGKGMLEKVSEIFQALESDDIIIPADFLYSSEDFT